MYIFTRRLLFKAIAKIWKEQVKFQKQFCHKLPTYVEKHSQILDALEIEVFGYFWPQYLEIFFATILVCRFQNVFDAK